MQKNLNSESVTDWFENVVKPFYVDFGILPENTYGMDESSFPPAATKKTRSIGACGPWCLNIVLMMVVMDTYDVIIVQTVYKVAPFISHPSSNHYEVNLYCYTSEHCFPPLLWLFYQTNKKEAWC